MIAGSMSLSQVKLFLRRRRFFFSVHSSVVRKGAGVLGCCSKSESEVLRFNWSVCVVLGSFDGWVSRFVQF